MFKYVSAISTDSTVPLTWGKNFIHGSTFYQKTAKNYKNSSDKENLLAYDYSLTYICSRLFPPPPPRLHFNQTSIPISTVNKISGIRNTVQHSNYSTNSQRFLYESFNANELYQITPNLGLTHIIKVLKSYM